MYFIHLNQKTNPFFWNYMCTHNGLNVINIYGGIPDIILHIILKEKKSNWKHYIQYRHLISKHTNTLNYIDVGHPKNKEFSHLTLINKTIKTLHVTGFNKNYLVFFEDKNSHNIFLIELIDFW